MKIGLLILIVSISNICINIFNKKASLNNVTFQESLFSQDFFIAFVFGMISILTMLYLYSQNINLSKGILFMGVTSILGGSMLALFLNKESFNKIEWCIVVVLAIFYTVRLFSLRAS